VFQIVVDIVVTCVVVWLFLRGIFWLKKRGDQTNVP
jgi:hypothetical protein